VTAWIFGARILVDLLIILSMSKNIFGNARFGTFLAVGLVVLGLILSSCGEGEIKEQKSAEGLLPEEFLPKDAGIFAGYSVMNDDQFAALQNLKTKADFAGDISKSISDRVDSSLSGLGLSYETDLKPALGGKFRLVYTEKPKEAINGEVAEESISEKFAVVTLMDPAKMQTILIAMVDGGRIMKQNVSGMDVYKGEDGVNYMAIHKDLLLIASDPESLIAMTKLEKGESLWDSETYQDFMEKGADESIFYGAVDPSSYTGGLSAGLSGIATSGVAGVIKYEGVLVKAEESGFKFDFFVVADEEKAKETDVVFDSIPKIKSYLLSEVPNQGLVIYVESYGLKQSMEDLEKSAAEEDEESSFAGIEEYARTYFGMDLKEDILAFLDKGYVFAFHKNGEEIIPGITIYADVSSAPDKARTFLDKLDGQITGLMITLEQALPGAVSKGTVDVNGEILNMVRVDMSKIPNTDGSPLPAVVTTSSLEIVYGILGDRLLITTAPIWQGDAVEKVSDGSLYKSLDQHVSNGEGLVLFDSGNAGEFFAALRALREQLQLEISEPMLAAEDVLKVFEGFIGRSETSKYEVHSSGYLLMAE
jgi:hypothetical protein